MQSSEMLERHTLGNGTTVFIYRPYRKKGGTEKETVVREKEQEEEHEKQCLITAILPRVGGSADPLDAPGTAHFREHIAYQGTTSYPTCEHLVNALGHSFKKRDGQTSQTWTAYAIDIIADKMPATLPILGELITSPLIDEERTAHERDIIAAEFRERMLARRPLLECALWNRLYDTYAFAHQPIGTPDSIRQMSVETLLDFQRRYYHAGNLACICAGDFPPTDQLLAHLESAFGRLGSGQPFAPAIPALPYGGEGEEHNPGFLFDSLVISYPLPKPDLRARIAWGTLAHYLNRDDSASAGFELRERRRLVYGTGYARFILGFMHAVMEFVVPVQRNHFTIAYRIVEDALTNLTEAHWLVSPDRAGNRLRVPRKPLTQPRHPNSALGKIKEALCNGDNPGAVLDDDIRERDMTWDDLNACRNQLLATKPFIFRALA